MTELATRDRLFDDQAQTIGKLQFERDRLKDALETIVAVSNDTSGAI